MYSQGNHPVIARIAVGVFFLILMSMALQGLYQDEQFENAPRSQGTVERSWTTYGRKGSTRYHVSYDFADVHGRIWAVHNDTSQGTYGSVHMGTIVPVRYLATDPNQSRIDWPNEMQYHWHQDKVLFCIALVLGVFFALMSFAARKS